MSADAARLKVVGGPEERREAEDLESLIKEFHGAVHDLKQTEPILDELFGRLARARAGLAGHGVKLQVHFDPVMQAALERWVAAAKRQGEEAERHAAR